MENCFVDNKFFPLVSVIIPVYNREKTIEKSIRSVLTQTYTNFEVIVCDDASTDHTEEIVKKIDDERVKYIRAVQNGGAGSARNMGIRIANGDFIAFHDSDDYCRPERLERQLNFLKKTNSDMVFAQLVRHTLQKPERSSIYPVDGLIGKTREETYKNHLGKSGVWTQVVFIRSECCKEILFDESLPSMEDWEWSLRVAKKYKISWDKYIVVDSYVSEDSISRSNGNKLITLQKMYPQYKEDLRKYHIEYMWKWLMAYYKYCDYPETHFDYGVKSLIYGMRTFDIKKCIFGIMYMMYIKPFQIIRRGNIK